MKPNAGFALAAAMMVLALLSVLAIASTQSTTLETQISAHDRDARAALYVAEGALEEARYYAARGWGKITWHTSAPPQVELATDMPRPVDFSWDGNRFRGLTLVDHSGDAFPIAGHTDDSISPTVIEVTGGDPAPGRFVVVRQGLTATWSDPDLTITLDSAIAADQQWAQAAQDNPDAYRNWSLWDRSNGRCYTVQGSSGDASVPNVVLTLSAGLTNPPAGGPYDLALSPWVAALAEGQHPPGDGDVTTAAWDRTFVDASGNPAGRAEVEATLNAPGEYKLSSTGHLHNGHRAVSLTVIRAGLPEQRLGDWKVEGEL